MPEAKYFTSLDKLSHFLSALIGRITKYEKIPPITRVHIRYSMIFADPTRNLEQHMWSKEDQDIPVEGLRTSTGCRRDVSQVV